ncbi:MAG: carbohydrate binding family 9 domain-containing protein [Armatimonadetes bacterium]|nr:carbohydrate binding family 9 domain-containing protein [Armatimonadota bacterium]
MRLGCLMVMSLGLASAAEPELPRATVARVTGAMVVDGRLDEPFWKQTAEQGGFGRLGGKGTPSVATTFRVAADATALRVGIVCQEPNPEQLVARTSRRDGPIWSDDSVEFLVQPGPRFYYQFAVNAAAAQFDARVPLEGGAGTAEATLWDGVWQTAVHREAGFWSVELRLPWAALDLGPETLGTWRLNVGRTAARRMEYSAWAPVVKGFHDLPRFGYLDGLAIKPTDYPLDGSRLQIPPLRVGGNRFRLRLPARRAGPYQVKMAVQRWAPGPPPARRPVGQPLSAKGGELAMDLRVPVKEAGVLQQLVVEVAEASGRPLLLRAHLFQAPDPLVANLAWPVAYAGDGQVRAAVTVALAPGFAPGLLTARLTSNGKAVGKPTAFPLPRSGDYPVALPLTGLPDDLYQLELTARVPEVGEFREVLPFYKVVGPFDQAGRAAGPSS